jgi:hypothetical protein
VSPCAISLYFTLNKGRYGGHYGPVFAAYFLSQNAAIAAGTINGITLNLKTLGIGDGFTASSLILGEYIRLILPFRTRLLSIRGT